MRQILPIFLLYTLTSVLFLALVSNVFYEREKFFIADRDAFAIRDFKHGLEAKLARGGRLKESDFDAMQAYAADLNSSDEIARDFEPRDDAPRVYMEGSNRIEQFNLTGKDGTEYYVAIKTDALEGKLAALKFKILAASALVLALILLIAYFIIRLSLRPLYEKIEFLNGFIRDTTHEIKTPLSVILMSIELFDTDAKKYLGNIKAGANTINALFEDLTALSLNKSGSGREVNLGELLQSRIEYFGVSAEQKCINLRADLRPVAFCADEFKLRKIIDNLLGNAIKYCDELGCVEVSLRERSLCIKNSGAGIARQNLPHIFELYTRFDQRNGGFGIGLFIVKKYCDELGLKISCDSNEDWTEFEVKF
ncbi:HAMP domain-containing sensor histidine kinase [uncultured Campylobacter sp.]|uniref:sensor histidine kinase n=1 Tax=uncultured Campylobacter sp. TaxID=218934 RepID=UPI00261974DD|nr:HAMP domain-containing sensor histidine kinase [uncultured Campylobacter sp.]